MTFSLRIMARELQRAMSACAQIVDPSNAVPILRATRISATETGAEFIATNTEQTAIIRAAAIGSGVVCLDTPALAAKIALLRPDAETSFDGGGQFVTITQGKTRWKLPTMLDDFPMQVAREIQSEPIKVGRAFMAAISQAHGGIDPKHPNPTITGVCLNGNHVVGSNGKCARQIQVEENFPHFTILPGKLVPKLVSMMPDGGELRLSETLMSLSTEGMTVNSRLIDGQPVNTETIIAQFREKLVHRARIAPKQFVEALKRAGAIKQTGEQQSAFLNMQLRFRYGEIEIFSRNMNGEEGFDTSPCERDGPDVDIGFVGEHLIGEISSIPADFVMLHYLDDRSHMVASAGENVRFIQCRTFR